MSIMYVEKSNLILITSGVVAHAISNGHQFNRYFHSDVFTAYIMEFIFHRRINYLIMANAFSCDKVCILFPTHIITFFV